MRERQMRTIWRNVFFLVVITILLLLSNRERSLLDMFTGFVYGVSFWELAYTIRDMRQAKRKLK